MSPELLAPAGDLDCLRAAVANGADAVYFGLAHGFNARARATNLPRQSLGDAIAYLHRYGVRGYVTLNTLVFPDELAEAERTLREVAAAGVDAVLVQDLGLARLIREVCPDLSLHASTQMTLTSAECIEAIRALGIERVVLPRELSIDQIARLREQTDVELEAFVHGALCVAYSGQCLTSESLGGRSANRGQCAQACRLPYEVVCDGRDVDLGDVKYLLSPQDLAAYALLPELLAAGVTALKIEGRLKSPEYVANITRHYRRALDAALAGRPVELTPREVEEMELSFSRGFSPGWLAGNDHKRLVPGLSSAKRGVLVGTVRRARRGRVLIELQGRLKRGDGIVFAGDRAAGNEQGGRVYELFQDGAPLAAAESGPVEIALARGAVDFERLWTGQAVWKTDDPQLAARWRKTFAGAGPSGRVGIEVTVRAAVGEPLVAQASDGRGAVCEARSPAPLAAAIRHPLDEAVLREQFGRLGGTPYRLDALRAELIGAPMAPLSVLGKLRHELVAALDARRTQVPPRRLAAEPAWPRLCPGRAPPRDDAAPRELYVLCRSLPQLRAALAAGVQSAAVDFADLRQYAEAVAAARDSGAKLLLATPRIHKPGETGVFRALERQGADGILARNLAGLRYFAAGGRPVVADFSLNAANPISVELLRAWGAARVTASYDLNRDQLLELAGAVDPAALEVVVHQYMPMFHMEHCVFCAVLSPGTNPTNCGRPCDRHFVQLRDRVGMLHPLAADVGCRNTLFNATPQSGAEVVAALLARGVRHFRVELLHDQPTEDVARTIGLYRDLLAGRLRGEEVWRQLQAANRVGVTRGTLEERRNPLAIL